MCVAQILGLTPYGYVCQDAAMAPLPHTHE